MATGLKNPAAPEECAHGEKLVGSAKNGGVGIIRFKSLHGFATLKQWSIHKELMESECDGLKWQAGDCCTYDLRPEFPLQVFDLFIRWLYTRKYQEKEGLAWSFDTCLTLLSAPLEIDVAPRLRVDWPVKAAIASWELGATLHAKNFQNYAIKRLFEAFSRPLSQPLAPALLAYVFQLHKESFAEGSSQLQQLVQDVFVRNWGDVTIIDHTDQGLWSFFVGLCPSFREDFLAATKHAPEKRQEKELDLANHH